jgi:hypothetical protein
MNTIFKKLAVVLGVALMGSLMTATASAACGNTQPAKPGASLKPQSWHGQNYFGASLLFASENNSNDPIVGMWHVSFTAKGNSSDGPPDNTPIDNALVVWHSDGTEIMTSARPPQDGDICLGVWEKTGRCQYKLNHLPWLANDTTNAPTGIGNPTGPTRIVVNVVLSPDGNHYTGTFTLDAYDTSGNPTAHIIDVISGKRITLETTVGDLL